MLTILQVAHSWRNNTPLFTFATSDPTIGIGDIVICNTQYGESFGRVVEVIDNPIEVAKSVVYNHQNSPTSLKECRKADIHMEMVCRRLWGYEAAEAERIRPWRDPSVSEANRRPPREPRHHRDSYESDEYLLGEEED